MFYCSTRVAFSLVQVIALAGLLVCSSPELAGASVGHSHARAMMVVETAQSDGEVLRPSSVQRLETEIANVRALPIGYVARCDDGTLEISSKRSGTFLISESELCKAGSEAVPPALRKGFTLCSNDATIQLQAEHPSVPECKELMRHHRSI